MYRSAPAIGQSVVLACLIVALLGACSQAEEEASPAVAPSYEPVECSFPGAGSSRIECGHLVVPEDRTQPDSGTVRLYAVVIPSVSDNPEPDPLVFLSGGPGDTAVVFLEYILGGLAAVLRERDLIVFDQRGVGLSEPSLNCPECEEVRTETYGAGVSSEEARERMLHALRACRDRLTEQGANLSAYNSAASAADVHDLMEALGYSHYNLYGVSYGTRLALTLMRDYPDEVRSAVLDSVVPPQEDLFELWAVNAQRAVEQVFEQCALSETCSEKYPDLAETFFSLVKKLEEEPLAVSVQGTTYQVGGEEFVELVTEAMHNTAGISGLPNTINKVADGQTIWLTGQVRRILSLHQIQSEGVRLSVWCAEEVPFNSAEDAEEINAGVHPAFVQGLEADSLPWLVQLCEMWGAAEAEAVEGEPVRVDVPALILTGEFDPVTPRDFANSAAEYLEKAQSYVVPGHTHGVLGSSVCAQKIMKQFLDTPGETPDASCLDKLKLTFK